MYKLKEITGGIKLVTEDCSFDHEFGTEICFATVEDSSNLNIKVWLDSEIAKECVKEDYRFSELINMCEEILDDQADILRENYIDGNYDREQEFKLKIGAFRIDVAKRLLDFNVHTEF